MELFAKAVKLNITFSTERGNLLPQDIYSLPLLGNNGFNLDTLSRQALKKVRSVEEESLVSKSTVNPEDQLRLDLLKFIIEDKQAEEKKAEEAVLNKAKLEKLLAIKAKRQEDKVEQISDEELEVELEALTKA